MNNKQLLIPVLLSQLVACGGGSTQSSSTSNTPIADSPTEPVTVNCDPLATVLQSHIDTPVGVAIPAGNFNNSVFNRECAALRVANQFNQLTAENIMKFEYLQPNQGVFTFAEADELVAFAKEQQQTVHGHTLIWHRAVPQWLQNFDGTAAELRAILIDHIQTVVSHFDETVTSWDVVNEVIEDDTDASFRQTLWYDTLGRDYIDLAFTTARATNPAVDLYYNDYSISWSSAKQTAVLNMVDTMLENNIPIDGVGFQMHVDTEWPPLCEIEKSFEAVVDRGLKVRVSEIDIAVNKNGLSLSAPTTAMLETQKARYSAITSAYLRVVPTDLQGGITVWGLNDGDSWIPGEFNRSDWPLMFDDNIAPKPAYFGMNDALASPEMVSDCP